MFIQGIVGAEGPPGKDGLVGQRVRSNTCLFFPSSGFGVPCMQLCVLTTGLSFQGERGDSGPEGLAGGMGSPGTEGPVGLTGGPGPRGDNVSLMSRNITKFLLITYQYLQKSVMSICLLRI